jgi:hypothetical protein
MHKALLALVVSLGVAHTAATAVESRPAPEEGADAPAAETVRYPADFFAPYRPVTARDMVDQVPGFRIDNGDRSRGFGGAAGNVLIDGERPSSKQDTVSEILARIPADRVAAVELIRGNTGRYDAAGQTRLVNVVLDTQRRSWTWEATVEQDTDSGPPTPGASLSLVDRTGSTRWGAGIAANTVFVGGTAVERLFVDGEVLERRDESDRFRRASIRINANSETRMDQALLRFNGEVRYVSGDFFERSLRSSADGDEGFRLDRRSDDDELEYELGGDIEWPLTRTWQAKLIGLHRGETEDERQRQLFRIDPAPPELRRIALGESTETESIGRLELDWPVAPTQLFEIDVETAFNELDNVLALKVRDDGVLVPVEVPGANNRVSELRGEAELRDTREFGPFSLESALAAEVSSIRQSGGDERDFMFLKPALTLVHAARTETVNRFRLAREVAQLNFGDFVSSADFGDEDIDRGNPGLEPQRTWRAEASTERRFGAIGAAKLTAFHDWVEQVQDLLPIDDRFEVPGNIGDGRSWGLTLEGTLPLAPLGIDQGRLDVEARWRDSKVTDPVTERPRRFTGQRRYWIESAFRQDFTDAGWAWGFETEFGDRSTRYELEELDINDQGVDLEAFIETTRYFGVKLQLIAQNLLDQEFTRDRTVFVDSRADGDPAFRELRQRRRGRSLLLTVSGAF